jgi:adenylate cyclase
METPRFVARERELRQLDRFLNAALAGRGQVCFVSGEAGSGKSALVSEFARRAVAQHPDLVAAFGQGDAQTGIGDPYLPFREVLSQLTGDADSQRARAISVENATRLRKLGSVSARFLVEIAPELVGLFVPGVGVAMKAAKATADKAGWLGKLEKLAQRPRLGEGLTGSGADQNLVFEQYTRFVTALSEKKPLLLILDDLHWADPSSLALLFRLGRRITRSRILLVGTYRPEEVAQQVAGGRHPLEKVVAELKRYLGEFELSLDVLPEADRRGFVDSLLDSEPNDLGEGFRRALLQHTDGHALFTVELLRALQERGDLVQDPAGRWVPGPALDWGALPPRVEGVIEERIGRLAEGLREALTVASVEGEEFTAEVVAQVREMEARELVWRLSEELQKEHRLVSAQGLRRLAARRLALYRFQHNLFQKYLYNGLDAVERACLHEDVGSVLEALYGEQIDEVAVQLARHFEEAGVADKAARYLQRSGELAAARYANEEAATYFSRALALLPETDLVGRYGTLLARQKVYNVLGQRDAQARDLMELEGLAQGLGVEQQAEVAVWQAKHAVVMGQYLAATVAAQAAVERGQAVGKTESEAMGHLFWGLAIGGLSDSPAARAHLEEAAALARVAGLPRVEARALLGLGNFHDAQADAAAERSYYEQARSLYHQAGDREGEALTLLNLEWLQMESGDYAGACAANERGLILAREIGWRMGEASALARFGWLYSLLGDYSQAQGYFEQALSIARDVADRDGEGRILSALGMLSHRQTDYARAQAYEEQALHLAREIGAQDLEGAAHSTLGDVCQDLGDLVAARGHFEQALHLFHQIDTRRDDVLESVVRLAGAALALGDLPQAQAYVAEILAYLEEGGMLRASCGPFRMYLTCYRALRAVDDPCALAILAKAHRLLQEHAARTPDAALRRSFLENVAENREIVAEFARAQKPD